MNINEVSIQTGISKDMIRFYEKKGIIHPKRKENNYRDYSVEDVHTIILAKQYSLMGMQLSTISKLLKESVSTNAIHELDMSIQQFENDLLWANARLKNAKDFRDIFQMIENDIPYQVVQEKEAYFYPSVDQHGNSIVHQLLQHGNVSKAVFRIRPQYIDGDTYPQDYGLLLPQKYPDTNYQYDHYGENLIYRTIVRQKSGQLITNKILQEVRNQIEHDGYTIIGDIFISQLTKEVHLNISSNLICVESIVDKKTE